MDVIVLTGIGAGLGKALHDLLVEKHFSHCQKVFISHTHPDEIDTRQNTRYVNLNFSSDIQGLEIEGLSAEARRIIFLNNAGVVSPIGSMSKLDSDMFRTSLNINLHAPVKIAAALTSVAKSQGSNLLVFNISSGAANRAIKGWMPYCVGKAAVKMAFDVLAAEEPLVDVVHFDPGVMDTAMQSVIRESSDLDMPDVQAFRALKETRNLKTPETVAGEILKLLKICES